MTKNRPNYLKWLLFTLMGITTLTVVYYKILQYSHPSPALVNRYLPTKWILVPHIVFATIALVTGPFQFSDRLRKRNLQLHRTIGKVYVLAVLFAGSFALAWSFAYDHITNPANVRSIVQAVVWLLATAVAWLAVRNRQISHHQVWMARSYGITFAFVLARFSSYLPVIQQMSDENYIHFLWVLLVFSLVIPELLVNGKILLVKPAKRDVTEGVAAKSVQL